MAESEATQKRNLKTKYPIEPKVWIGFTALVVCILLAAGLGNLIGVIFPNLSELEEFAWSHFIPLPIAIIAGVFFIKRAGWIKPVWKVTPAYKDTVRRRRWLLLFPILLGAQAIVALATTPWAESSFWFILISLVAMALVAINEELYFRGIFRFTLDYRHGQTVTLFATALAFGLAHSFGSFFLGMPIGFIAFQVATTAMLGVVYYAAFLATGRLWVPIVFHFITDFTLRLASGETDIGPVGSADPSPVYVGLQVALMVMVIPLVVSAVRYDLYKMKEKRSAA